MKIISHLCDYPCCSEINQNTKITRYSHCHVSNVLMCCPDKIHKSIGNLEMIQVNQFEIRFHGQVISEFSNK